MQTVAAASSAGRYSSSEASGSAGGRRGTARGKVREGLGGFEQNQRRRTSLPAQTHHHQAWFGSCQQQPKWHGGVVEAVVGGHHLRAGRPEHPSHESAASLPSVATSAAPSATGCAEPTCASIPQSALVAATEEGGSGVGARGVTSARAGWSTRTTRARPTPPRSRSPPRPPPTSCAEPTCASVPQSELAAAIKEGRSGVGDRGKGGFGG